MFNNKKKQLHAVPAPRKVGVSGKARTGNAFIQASTRKSFETRSENGALKLSSTGDDFVDQFGKLGKYREPRNFAEISKDTVLLHSQDPLMSIRFIIYLRTITRQVQFPDGSITEEPQRGAELKHEPIMRMLWLAINEPDIFFKNLPLFVVAGSWKDFFEMLRTDLVYHNWEGRKLDWDQMGAFLLAGLENPNTSELIKKYLPTIKASSAAKTAEAQANNMIGKWICSLLFGRKEDQTGATYRKYRKLKSSGTAHTWQQVISRSEWSKLDFKSIHGRALQKLVKSKFLKNRGMEHKFETWAKKEETIKYTGFVHELFRGLATPISWSGSRRGMPAMTQGQIEALNKQFMELVRKGGEAEASKLIVVRDTSASMGQAASGETMSCYDIAKALALYFSYFLEGPFQGNWIEFHNTALMHTWKGDTPYHRWVNDRTSHVGSTNFQSVIELFCELKAEGIAEEEFPEGILCISDGEFNPARSLDKTNVVVARDRLRRAGFSKSYVAGFKIVLWNLARSRAGDKFETTALETGTMYLSGYSAANVGLLTSRIDTPRELFEAAMSQELVSMVEI